MHTADRAGNITYANEAHTRTLGYQPEELVGRNVRDLIHEDAFATPGYGHDFAAGEERLIKEGRISFDVAWRHQEGHKVEGRVSVVAIYDEAKEFIGSYATFHDITERVRAQEALQQHTKRLRALTAQRAEVVEAERQRLARELHDQVGQNLTALSINLNILRAQKSSHGSCLVQLCWDLR